MQELTTRQQQIFDYINAFIEDNQMPPTRAEIAAEMGFRSITAAVDHLKVLERKGYIETLQGSSRGIRVLYGAQGIPLIGRVAAGEPILAEEHIEDHIAMPGSVFQPPADYLLRVSGDSMRDIGILDGDLLAVHRVEEARNGQVVVARLNDEVTVKRFKKKGRHVWLMPENGDFEPIEVDLANEPLSIEGLAVGVIRNGSQM